MAREKVRNRLRSQRSVVAEVDRFIRRFVVMSDAQSRVTALWVVHTHCVDVAEQTPYLAITSPEKQCGKSRLLEVLELLVARPWETVLPSEAVLYRKVHARRPTLLWDEIDTIFNPRSAERYDAHRSLLNAGHRRGATVSRCLAQSGNFLDFSVFSAKAIAGIGTLPETIADRSVPIRLARRKGSEEIERFRRRDVKPEAEKIVARIDAWLTDNRLERLRSVRPEMPDELSDRMQEGCEPLVAIADEAECGHVVRMALVELLTGERADDEETMRIKLLGSLREIFVARGNPKGIATGDLLAQLVTMEEKPWNNYYGRTFQDRDLAALLRPYDIRSTTIRPPIRRREDVNKKVFRGYKLDDLREAWERYL